MIPFSERYGFKSPKTVMQIDSMDDDLRNSLWNALTGCYWDRIGESLRRYGFDHPRTNDLLKGLWVNFFKRPVDTIPDTWSDTLDEIRVFFFKCEWYSVYDLVQVIPNMDEYKYDNRLFMAYCNSILEREMSAYRFVSGQIVRITSQEEIAAVEQGQNTSPNPVSIHLQTALALLSDRKNPDYRNSIKESISAVESISCLIASAHKVDLGQALGKIEGKVGLHPQLKTGFHNLYNYTSDADGIRHKLLDEPNLDFDDAKYMLVSCSAFVNYLIAKANKCGIDLKL